ncbi:hypothetical protein SCHPADRAFT_432261 [Schizopora paradoxa]|uniref:PROCT domain-containing protein n=1 Tax=Schizopora paradoxa TaxID=27342 RepID=A0A0H2RJM8_9AGAM|nr:hypothetical protein SCHPADRAFT_432261 [Schizopora paradoxa]
MVLFNKYGMRFPLIFTNTASSRFLVLLRSLYVNKEETKIIPRPDKSKFDIRPGGHGVEHGTGLANSWMRKVKYYMPLDSPLPFWAEPHRPSHFLSFASMESGDDNVDVENSLEQPIRVFFLPFCCRMSSC